ncbi:MAG: hypothetical protein ACYTGQ_08465 [Planctomycetota bacterium]|jgi:nitric oxide reductase large subunit
MKRVSIQSVVQLVFILTLLIVVSIWVRPQALQGEPLTAPPVPRFLDETGRVLVTADQIIRGQAIYVGASEAPTHHPDTLAELQRLMQGYHAGQRPEPANPAEAGVRNASIARRVELELGYNRYDPVVEAVTLTESQVVALQSMRFAQSDNGDSLSADALTAYLFWSGWMRGIDRPNYSVTYQTLGAETWSVSDTALQSERMLVPFLLLILVGTTVGIARSLASRDENKHALV